jgi:hypothetical protein
MKRTSVALLVASAAIIVNYFLIENGVILGVWGYAIPIACGTAVVLLVAWRYRRGVETRSFGVRYSLLGLGLVLLGILSVADAQSDLATVIQIGLPLVLLALLLPEMRAGRATDKRRVS